jgi:hypothetical protein
LSTRDHADEEVNLTSSSSLSLCHLELSVRDIFAIVCRCNSDVLAVTRTNFNTWLGKFMITMVGMRLNGMYIFRPIVVSGNPLIGFYLIFTIE